MALKLAKVLVSKLKVTLSKELSLAELICLVVGWGVAAPMAGDGGSQGNQSPGGLRAELQRGEPPRPHQDTPACPRGPTGDHETVTRPQDCTWWGAAKGRAQRLACPTGALRRDQVMGP